jgi:hypothetical protein
MFLDFDELVKQHSGELVILTLTCFVLGTLIVVVPQLLRMQVRKMEMAHEERLKSIEKGLPLLPVDNRGSLAGRIALLVPMVAIISAATVSSFLVVYKSENLFAVSLAIWVVAGIVSLAAVTGGVALMGRLASLEAGDEDLDEVDEGERSESSYMN